MDFGKMYKPVFIVFADMLVAITFFIGSFLHYFNFWMKSKTPLERVEDFMPERVVYYNILLFAKLGFDLFVMAFIIKKHKLNRSKSTAKLYWNRIAFDFLVIGGLMFAGRYIMKIHQKGTIGLFKLALVVPKVILEIVLYHVSVKPARKRAIYQQHSKWKKGGPCPFNREAEINKFFVQMKTLKEKDKQRSMVDEEKFIR